MGSGTADQYGAQPVCAVGLRSPSTDHHRPRGAMGELQPVGAAPSGTVSGRESFADDTLQGLLQGRGPQRIPVIIGGWHRSAGVGNADLFQDRPPLRKWLGGEIGAL